MATINAPSLYTTVYSGDSPLAVAHGSVVLAAAAVGDKVRLSKVFAGAKVYDAKTISGALGAGVTVSLGFEYVNGEAGGSATAFLNAADCAAAGKDESSAAPVTFNYDAYVIATIGGAVATGQLDSVLAFEPLGK